LEENKINQNLIKTLYKSRYKIIITTLVFVIASIVLTMFIPKKYMAYGVVYPTNSNNITEVVKNPDFGFDIHADRLIQLFESQKMKDQIVKEFDLINYYKLDTTKKGWIYSLNENYSKDITFNRTRYLSVAIQANMRNSEMAANIVNRLIELIDNIREDVFKSNQDILIVNFKGKLENQDLKVKKILIELYDNKPSKGTNNKLVENRLKQIDSRTEKGVVVMGDDFVKEVLKSNLSIKKEELLNDYYHELGVLNRLRNEYATIKEKSELPFPSVYKVVAAEADEKKASPSQIVNASIAFIIGLLFSITMVIVPSRVKDIIQQVKE
jgi:LPS O-antigen subunit length determinant protein (WzzB/FepE family)